MATRRTSKQDEEESQHVIQSEKLTAGEELDEHTVGYVFPSKRAIAESV